MQNTSPSQTAALRALIILAYIAVFYFLIPVASMFIWFTVGVVCGVVFLFADEQTLHRWYRESGDGGFLVTRSPLFLIALPPLAVMVLTSFGSFWASGVIGGMMLWLLLEMLELRRQPEMFLQRFLRGVKTDNPAQTVRVVLMSGWVFFILIHGLTFL